MPDDSPVGLALAPSPIPSCAGHLGDPRLSRTHLERESSETRALCGEPALLRPLSGVGRANLTSTEGPAGHSPHYVCNNFVKINRFL